MTTADRSEDTDPEHPGAAHPSGTPAGHAPAELQGYRSGNGEAPVPSRRRTSSSRDRLRALLAVVVLAAVVVAALWAAGVIFTSKSAPKVTVIKAPATAAATAAAEAGLKAPGVLSVGGPAPFTLHYPPGWTQLTTAQLAKIPNAPAAGLVAEGGRALLLVRPKQPLTQSIATLSNELTSSLKSHFTDFKLLSTGTTRTLAGPAWVYTFERTKQGLVQSEVVVSTSKAAYELDIALRGGANKAAQQIGEIVHSFQS